MDGGAVNEDGCVGLLGLPYKIPRVGRLKQQKLVFSRF